MTTCTYIPPLTIRYIPRPSYRTYSMKQKLKKLMQTELAKYEQFVKDMELDECQYRLSKIYENIPMYFIPSTVEPNDTIDKVYHKWKRASHIYPQMYILFYKQKYSNRTEYKAGLFELKSIDDDDTTVSLGKVDKRCLTSSLTIGEYTPLKAQTTFELRSQDLESFGFCGPLMPCHLDLKFDNGIWPALCKTLNVHDSVSRICEGKMPSGILPEMMAFGVKSIWKKHYKYSDHRINTILPFDIWDPDNSFMYTRVSSNSNTIFLNDTIVYIDISKDIVFSYGSPIKLEKTRTSTKSFKASNIVNTIYSVKLENINEVDCEVLYFEISDTLTYTTKNRSVSTPHWTATLIHIQNIT